MKPSVFEWLTSDAAVTALVGAGDAAQIFDAGYAPEGVSRYVVWQVITGDPELYLDAPSDMDRVRVQFDCFADNAPDSLELAEAVRTALESHGHCVSLNGDARDEATRRYFTSFDFEFHIGR